MFKVPHIENYQFYSDLIMKSMQSHAQKEKLSIQERWSKSASTQKKDLDEIQLNKRKDLELQKVRHLNDRVNHQLRKIVSKFPKFNHIDDIYIKLINTSPTPVKQIEKALDDLLYIATTTDQFSQNTLVKIKRAKTHPTIGFIMKKYLGKVNSLYSKKKSAFTTLREAGKFLNRLPSFESLYTAAISGFPNVGKSTLMKDISGSDVEIQDYPFTTKGLMFGYIKEKGTKQVQLIDTPGLLGRKKNNSIEERALIVLSDYSDIIVFVLDVTESCGYSLDEQVSLLKTTAKLEKEILLFLSKVDIYSEEDEDKLQEIKAKIKKFKLFRDRFELRDYVVEESLKRKPVFDPKKIKLIK